MKGAGMQRHKRVAGAQLAGGCGAVERVDPWGARCSKGAGWTAGVWGEGLLGAVLRSAVLCGAALMPLPSWLPACRAAGYALTPTSAT